jgi:hypothetical protein
MKTQREMKDITVSWTSEMNFLVRSKKKNWRVWHSQWKEKKNNNNIASTYSENNFRFSILRNNKQPKKDSIIARATGSWDWMNLLSYPSQEFRKQFLFKGWTLCNKDREGGLLSLTRIMWPLTIFVMQKKTVLLNIKQHILELVIFLYALLMRNKWEIERQKKNYTN